MYKSVITVLLIIGILSPQVIVSNTNGQTRRIESPFASQVDIVGPTGSGEFGAQVVVLPNGNIVVTDPGFDLPGPIANVGAVYLIDGSTRQVISTLTGNTTEDRVGSGNNSRPGVVALSNGNFVVNSTSWNGGRGAVTFGNGTTGVSGTVSAANSLTGSAAIDSVGWGGVLALTNGNYVVCSQYWNNGGINDAGAVTFGNGTIGISGTLSAANSLVGSTEDDEVGSTDDGFGCGTELPSGNYVVTSPDWDNGAAFQAGAVTFGNGTAGTSGPVSPSNSLVGATSADTVGAGQIILLSNGNYVVYSSNYRIPGFVVGAVTLGNGTTGVSGPVSITNSLIGAVGGGISWVYPLTNGNYVVSSSGWDNGGTTDVGAVTFGNGTTGVTGTVSATNSLVGSTAGDSIGNEGGITALSNGNYVVSSSSWDNGAVTNAGAITLGNGTTGTTGQVSVANSLVGSTAYDLLGNGGVTALTNGNYVVASFNWDNGLVTNAGAVTFGNGTTGVTGPVSSANSLVGSTASDFVGSSGVTALTNGNYVARSRNWANGAATNAGAVTFGNGTTGITGPVSASNSLVGSTASDFVGNSGVTSLTNGNYVARSRNWANGAATNAGAVTFGNGTTGITGPVSASNSLVGSTASDFVGNSGVTALTNGNYVARSRNWANGAATNAGAVTFGNGTTGITGPVSASNSLVGSTASDFVGSTDVAALSNGNYVVRSVSWDNGLVMNAGAVTYGIGTGGTVGPINSNNSVLGTVANGTIDFSSTLSNGRLVVGRPSSNIVTVFNPATSRTPFDYDGDGKSDPSVFRASNGTWYVSRSGLGDMYVMPWGLNGDNIVPADYDGDGKTDLAVRRPADNNFYIFNSSNSTMEVRNFGIAGDIALPSDYNGDGKADVAVWRPSNGTWYLSLSGSGIFYVMPWGLAADKPVPGDYDGDGKTDLAVFRPTEGRWYMFNTVTGAFSTNDFGMNGDTPVQADYSGDGKTDFAVYRASNNTWYRQHTNDGTFNVSQWGLAGDFPTPGDFDGDGRTDVAVWRPSNGTWYVLKSTSGVFTQSFGTSGDTPTPNAFVD